LLSFSSFSSSECLCADSIKPLSFPWVIRENGGGVLANAAQITGHRELLDKKEEKVEKEGKINREEGKGKETCVSSTISKV